jgi:HKD family nuclease
LPRCRVRILTSDDLDVTDPEALRRMLLLRERGAEVKVLPTADAGSLHLKADVFARVHGGHLHGGTAFSGSSNISWQALQDGLEWNHRVVYPNDPASWRRCSVSTSSSSTSVRWC